MRDRSDCTSCERPIYWAITENAKRQPIDAEPDPAGNLAVYRDALGVLRSRVLGDGEQPEPWEKRAMPHHATCTHADEHRRGRRKAPKQLPPNVIRLDDRRKRR